MGHNARDRPRNMSSSVVNLPVALRLPTLSIASFTLSDLMSLLLARLLMRSSLVAPELLQAMLIALFRVTLYVDLVKKDGPRVRVSFVRKGSVTGNQWLSQGRCVQFYNNLHG